MSYLTESQEQAFVASQEQAAARPPRWPILPVTLRVIAWIALLGGALTVREGIITLNGTEDESQRGLTQALIGGGAIINAFAFFFAAHLLRWLQLIEWRLRRDRPAPPARVTLTH